MPHTHAISIPTLRGLLLVGIVVSLGACGTLQDVSYLDEAAPDQPKPTVTSAQGNLSPQAARSLLLRRWKNRFADTQALAALEELATSQPWIAGNQVTLLYDGPQTMAAMTRAIADAKNHINLETFIFDADAVGTAMAELLMERQRAGVQVNIIYDAVGTMSTPQAFFERMRAAGIHLLAFHPVNPMSAVATQPARPPQAAAGRWPCGLYRGREYQQQLCQQLAVSQPRPPPRQGGLARHPCAN